MRFFIYFNIDSDGLGRYIYWSDECTNFLNSKWATDGVIMAVTNSMYEKLIINQILYLNTYIATHKTIDQFHKLKNQCSNKVSDYGGIENINFVVFIYNITNMHWFTVVYSKNSKKFFVFDSLNGTESANHHKQAVRIFNFVLNFCVGIKTGCDYSPKEIEELLVSIRY